MHVMVQSTLQNSFKQAYLKFNKEEWDRVEALHPDTYIDIQFKNVFKRLL